MTLQPTRFFLSESPMGEHEIERLIVRLMGDSRSYLGMLKQATQATVDFARAAQQQNDKVERLTQAVGGWVNSLKGYASTLASLAGLAAGFGLIAKSVGLAAQLEDAESEFGTMLGSLEKGKQLVSELRDLAAKTPLQSGPLQQATKMLLQFGVQSTELIPTLKMIGDVAGGDAQKLLQMSRAYGQMLATGKLQGDEMNQMIEAGFNPLQVLAERKGGSDKGAVQAEMARLLKLREAGQLSVGMIQEAFRIATSEGGRFFGYMENKSKTLGGLWSTLQDDIGLALSNIGTEIVKTFNLKEVVANVSKFFGELGRWVPFIAERLRDLGGVVGDLVSNKFTQLVELVRKFIAENQKLALGIALTTGAIVAGVAAWKLLRVAVTLTLGVMSLLHIQQITILALWVAWKVALLAVKVVVLLFNAQMAVYNGLVALATIATGTWTTASVLATAATWALNAAIAVLGAETLVALPIILFSVSLALIAVGSGMAAVGAAAYGVVKAASAVLDIFMTLPTSFGPLAAFSRLFDEWGEKLRFIAHVAETDLTRAWELLKIGGELAVSQLTDLWEPLWAFITMGFQEAGRVASNEFYGAWKIMYARLSLDIGRSLRLISQDQYEQMNRDLDAAQGRIRQALDEDLKKTQDRIGKAAKEFDKNLGESDRTKRLRGEFEKLQKEFQGLTKPPETGANALDKIAESAAKAAKEVQRFDQAIYGSAEALQRLQEYRDRVARADQSAAAVTGRPGGGAVGGMGGVGAVASAWAATVQAPAGGQSGAGGSPELVVLREIRDEIRAYNRSAGVGPPANIGNPTPANP